MSQMLIFHNLKKVLKGKFPRDCAAAVAKGGCMTTTIMGKWTNKDWRSKASSLLRTPAVSVMDRHESHTGGNDHTPINSAQNEHLL